MFKKDSIFQLAIFMALTTLFACGGDGDSSPSSPPPASASFPQRDSKYNSATDYYGPLTVQTGELYAQANVLPWTGYWLPTNNTYMFQGTNGGLSPLQKYDQYMAAKGVTTTAAAYESANLYNPIAGPADGHCDAWATASIYEPDPTPGGWQNAHNATLNGVSFTPGDLKALLTDIYETETLTHMLGEKYVGTQDDFNDLYPDQFQRILQAEIYGKNRPFIVDRDPGPDVWNTPIYSADVTITADSSNPNLMHESALIGTVNAIDESAFGQDPNWEGDPTLAIYNEEYTYDLYGTTQPDGTFLVQTGVWTGDSLNDHPDFALVEVDGASGHSSLNPQVTNDAVYEIIGKAQTVSN